MNLSQNNFFAAIQGLVTGGGIKGATNTENAAHNDAGFWRDIPIPLAALDLSSNVALAADETNGRVARVTFANDSVCHITVPIPRDYDEATDQMKVRVLASQLTLSTDDDVQLDSEVYIKTAGSALGSDLNLTAPGTVLSTTEQWIEFDLLGENLNRDDVMNFELITNGANDTDGEDVQIHAVEISYRSTLVSYDEQDSSGNHIR